MTNPPNNELPIIGHAGASAYLRERHGIVRSPATLAKYACVGCPGGIERPKIRKARRDVLYTPSGLDDFAARLISDPADYGRAA